MRKQGEVSSLTSVCVFTNCLFTVRDGALCAEWTLLTGSVLLCRSAWCFDLQLSIPHSLLKKHLRRWALRHWRHNLFSFTTFHFRSMLNFLNSSQFWILWSSRLHAKHNVLLWLTACNDCVCMLIEALFRSTWRNYFACSFSDRKNPITKRLHSRHSFIA